MQVKGDAILNKLILLFVFDKMECPLTENTIIDMCCSSNNWISYMDCKPILNQLLEYGFIYSLAQNGGDTLYSQMEEFALRISLFKSPLLFVKTSLALLRRIA